MNLFPRCKRKCFSCQNSKQTKGENEFLRKDHLISPRLTSKKINVTHETPFTHIDSFRSSEASRRIVSFFASETAFGLRSLCGSQFMRKTLRRTAKRIRDIVAVLGPWSDDQKNPGFLEYSCCCCCCCSSIVLVDGELSRGARLFWTAVDLGFSAPSLRFP